MKKQLFLLIASALLLGGCNNNGGGAETSNVDPSSSATSEVRPGTQFTVEDGRYISDAGENTIFEFASGKLNIDVYVNVKNLIYFSPNEKYSTKDAKVEFIYAEAFDQFHLYQNSYMSFTSKNRSGKDVNFAIFYSDNSGQKGDLFLAQINKTSSSTSYSINPLILYSESKVKDLASNLYKAGAGLYYFKSHEKVTVTLNDYKGGVETRNAYVRAHFDPGVNYLYIETSETGAFGQETKSYNSFTLHSFYASMIKETEALSSGVIRLYDYVSDTKSYKLAITDSGNVWTIPSVELFR